MISGIVTILVSTVTPPISEEHLYRLTFWSRNSTKVRIDLDIDTQYSTDEAKTTGKSIQLGQTIAQSFYDKGYL